MAGDNPGHDNQPTNTKPQAATPPRPGTADARTSGVPQLAGFAAGLVKDYDAVRNGLTLPYSSGAVEGNVCRLKAINRQMYGRANFDLLRLRVVLAE